MMKQASKGSALSYEITPPHLHLYETLSFLATLGASAPLISSGLSTI